MKCPTLNCSNVLAPNARKQFCARCRQSMGYHAKKRPAELLEYSRNLGKRVFRIEHIDERKSEITPLKTKPRRATR